MNQVIKDKMQRLIMVVKRQDLEAVKPLQNGFLSPDEKMWDVIQSKYFWHKRGEAEEDTLLKQIIPYWILKRSDWKIFLYQRWGAGSKAGEKRLHNRFSIGVWGHIEKKDVEGADDPVLEALLREMEEEVGLKPQDIKGIRKIGYINDDSNDVGKVHFWVVFEILVDDDFEPVFADGELQSGRFVEPSEISNLTKGWSMESWSEILLKSLKWR